jgi:hypothetical protein
MPQFIVARAKLCGWRTRANSIGIVTSKLWPVRLQWVDQYQAGKKDSTQSIQKSKVIAR